MAKKRYTAVESTRVANHRRVAGENFDAEPAECKTHLESGLVTEAPKGALTNAEIKEQEASAIAKANADAAKALDAQRAEQAKAKDAGKAAKEAETKLAAAEKRIAQLEKELETATA